MADVQATTTTRVARVKGSTMKSTIAIAAACAAATVGLGMPVATASPSPRVEVVRTEGDYLRATVVLAGALTRHAGNRHRLSYTHDWRGGHGQLTSYSCPAGATISARWTSTRCVERSRRPVTGGEVRLSATGRSARLEGTITSKGWVHVPLTADLVWKQQYPTPMVTFYDEPGRWSGELVTTTGAVTGSLAGTPLDRAQEHSGSAGRWERREVR